MVTADKKMMLLLPAAFKKTFNIDLSLV